jgi:hypothetical protein
MDKYIVWIISADHNYALKKPGISATYIIPSEMMRGKERSLVHSGTWLVIRGKRDNLSGYIRPSRIERFTDDYHKGDYLLHVNLTSSFRINSTNNPSCDSFSEEFKPFPTGISEIDDRLHTRLSNFSLSLIQIKFNPPSRSSISQMKLGSISKRKEGLAKSALSSVIQNFSLENIWGSGLGTKLNPFANFAHSLLADRFNTAIATECVVYLQAFDPLNALKESNEQQALTESISSTTERTVDIEFTEIEPESIYAREFIASDRVFNLEDALAKTEIAEKLHQDMLRDVSTYLKSRGIVPYETSSIDLMIREGDHLKIYEIKSTTEDNIVAQSARGSFQLAYYGEALLKEYGAIRSTLIIHKISNSDIEDICIRTLRRLSINCVIYDPSCDWPNRVVGLVED